MQLKTWISTILLSMICSFSVFASEGTESASFIDNTDHIDQEFTISGSKIITEDFSFKLPEHWDRSFYLSSNENSCEIYSLDFSEETESELLFSIDCYEDAALEDLTGCAVLGFCGNRTYILVSYYQDLEEETSGSLYRTCRKAEKQLKKSFVAYVTES